MERSDESVVADGYDAVMDRRTRAIVDMFESVTLGAPEHAVGFVMWRVVHRYQREIDRALAPLDLTHLQFTTLALVAWLGRDGTSATQAELARFGDIHPMQVSHMLRTLEEKGFVERERGETDSRTKRIAITTPGLATLRRAMPVAIEVQQRLFGEAGRPGGPLLDLLLRIDGARPEAES